jgi:hypothetical protein
MRRMTKRPLNFNVSLRTGFMSRLERATHIDFNRDNIIGRAPDVYYGQPPMYGGGGYGYGGGAPSMGYGGFPSMGYPGPMHDHHHHHHHGSHFY